MIEQLLLEMLAIDSTTGTETAFAEYLENYFSRRGYRVERQAVADGRFNLAVNTESAKTLFCTHLDTVPPFFSAREVGDRIYGRGACDAKGPLCAMIEAGDRLREEGVLDIGYLLVVGEELDGIGARRANERYRSDYLIVAEPTERKLVGGHKGVSKFRLEVEGILGHSAYPELGRSAIHLLLDLLEDLRRADHGEDDLLGKATFNVGKIEGGRAANVIADRASALCMLRSIDTAENSRRRIEALIDSRANIEWLSLKDPARMVALEAFEQTVVNFSSDIPYMSHVGEPLLFGPGSIRQAHTSDEYIDKKELLGAVGDYVRMVKALAKRAR
jgi:acetylornithine deacetylase